MNSMTGYGQGVVENDWSRVAVTIRTVNHRYLDLSLRLPEIYRAAEGVLREKIGRRLSRGHIEVRFEIEDRREKKVEVELNQEILAALVAAVDDWREHGLVAGELHIRDLIRFPNAIKVSAVSSQADPQILEQIFETLDNALTKTIEARSIEGEKLGARLTEYLAEIGEKTDRIQETQAEIREGLAKRFRQRLVELENMTTRVDDSRVAQEIAVLMERQDIQEEIDRLFSHQAQFGSVMSETGPIGRQLDFLAQEMFRELTTLATKCRHTSVMQSALDAKLICEQIREQIQNLE